MPVFSRKGIDCPQCAEFKPRVQINSAWHLQRTLCHLENAVSLGILREWARGPEREGHHPRADPRALGSGRDRFGWYDSLSLYFECTRCRRRYHLRGDTYHGNVWWEQAVR